MGKLKFVVQGFDEQGRVIDSVICSNAEAVREVTEKMMNMGAKEVNVEVTELGAY